MIDLCQTQKDVKNVNLKEKKGNFFLATPKALFYHSFPKICTCNSHLSWRNV